VEASGKRPGAELDDARLGGRSAKERSLRGCPQYGSRPLVSRQTQNGRIIEAAVQPAHAPSFAASTVTVDSYETSPATHSGIVVFDSTVVALDDILSGSPVRNECVCPDPVGSPAGAFSVEVWAMLSGRCR
jgi:hypothetical protein